MKVYVLSGVTVRMATRDSELDGLLTIPEGATGLVLFAHGSGSSRFSQRNQFVARCLQERRLGTLLFDLLTHEEEEVDNQTRQFRFNIELLADRLLDATHWARRRPDLSQLQLAYFGASTGAAAALIAAAKLPDEIAAVVSRGGRPDLAADALPNVKVPTMLIVGGADKTVLALNRTAQIAMVHARTKLAIVPEASHLFEESGALEQVADLAGEWICDNIAARLARARRRNERKEASATAFPS